MALNQQRTDELIRLFIRKTSVRPIYSFSFFPSWFHRARHTLSSLSLSRLSTSCSPSQLRAPSESRDSEWVATFALLSPHHIHIRTQLKALQWLHSNNPRPHPTPPPPLLAGNAAWTSASENIWPSNPPSIWCICQLSLLDASLRLMIFHSAYWLSWSHMRFKQSCIYWIPPESNYWGSETKSRSTRAK